jgi:hypothetical protein
VKKILIVLVIFILVSAGAGYWLFTRPGKEGVSLERVLPGEPLLLIEARDVQSNWNKFAETAFWDRLEKIDWDGVLRKAALDEHSHEQFVEVRESLKELLENEYLKKFFDKQVVLAAYPSEIDFRQLAAGDPGDVLKTFEKIFSSVVLVSRIPVDLQVIELASRFPGILGDDLKTSSKTYKGQTIQLIRSAKGLVLGYVRFQDLMIMGVGEEAARNSIDAFLGETGTLAGDQRYQESRKTALPEASGWFYWNVKDTFEILKKEMSGLQEVVSRQAPADADQAGPDNPVWENFDKNFAGFYTVAGSSVLDSAARSKLVLNYRAAEMSPEIRILYEGCEPDANGSLKYVPGDVLVYLWSNCLKPDQYWRQIQSEMEKLAPRDGSVDSGRQIAEFEQKLGLSIENDILAAIGNEFGGFLADINTRFLFPIPEIGLFVKVRDRAAMDRLLAKLETIPAVILQEENHGDALIRYVFTPLGDILQPSFAYQGDYLFLAVSRPLLKKVIDTSGGQRPGLAQDPDFKKIRPDLTQKSNAVQFVKLGNLAGKLKGLVEFGNSWAASQANQKQAFMSGVKQRLDEVRLKVSGRRDAVRDLENNARDLESRPPTEEIAEQIAAVRRDLASRKIELGDAEQEEAELAATVQGFSAQLDPAEERRYYLDAVVYPFLEALSTLPALGTRGRFSGESQEIDLYLDTGARP